MAMPRNRLIWETSRIASACGLRLLRRHIARQSGVLDKEAAMPRRGVLLGFVFRNGLGCTVSNNEMQGALGQLLKTLLALVHPVRHANLNNTHHHAYSTSTDQEQQTNSKRGIKLCAPALNVAKNAVACNLANPNASSTAFRFWVVVLRVG